MEATVSYLLMPQKYINSKQKTQTRDYTLCLGNIAKDFTINHKKKTGFKGIEIFCSADFSPIDTNNILDIHRYLMKGK